MPHDLEITTPKIVDLASSLSLDAAAAQSLSTSHGTSQIDTTPQYFGGATKVRYRIIAVSVAMAFILYLDRVCLGEIVKNPAFLLEFGGSKEELGNVLGAFFFTYALFQIPAGWASDRFGGRGALTVYIVAWSVLTAITGMVSTISGLLLIRLAFGIAQAGAYPTSGGVIRKWFATENRALASGWISMGGRIGGGVAPFLTTLLVLQFAGWRSVLFLYGIVGLGIAALYWSVVRNSPALHPRCNSEEIVLIGRPVDDTRTQASDILPMLWCCMKSRTLWLNSLVQFSVNIGWVFLITWLPTYLVEAKGVDPLQGAWMVSLILCVGIPAQLLGGWIGDLSVRKCGLRIGRVLPVSIACFLGGLAYIACLALDNVWFVVLCCAIVSLMTDIGNPPFWAISQDIGGRNTSSIFAWSNMWGNLGAAFSAFLVPRLMKWGEDSGTGDTMVFALCASAFFVSAFAVLGMDATKLVQSPKRVVT